MGRPEGSLIVGLRGSRVLAIAAVVAAVALLVASLGSVSAAYAGTLSITTTTITPWDSAGIGLYDTLAVNLTVDVTQAGFFAFEASLAVPTAGGSYANAQNTTFTSLSLGARTVSVLVPADEIRIQDVNGSFTVQVWVYTFSGAPLAPVASESVATPSWNASQFAPPAAAFAGPVTDAGVDVHGDGHYDELVVRVPFNVSRRATVAVTGLITGAGVFSEPQPAASYGPGSYVWNLTFPAEPLYVRRTDGPYAVSLTLARVAGPVPTTLAETVYRTAAYTYVEFARPTAHMSGGFTTSPLDPDADGLTDSLVLHVPLRVRAEGNFSVEATVACPCNGPIADRTRYVHLLPGSATVDVALSGVALNRVPSMNGASMGVRVANLDQDPQDTESLGLSYPTFNASRFDGNPVESLTVTIKGPAGSGGCYDAALLDPSTGFTASTTPPPSRIATFAVYNGTFDVLVDTCALPGYLDLLSRVASVTVAGATSVNISLPAPPAFETDYGLTLGSWSQATLTRTQDWSSASAWMRWTADAMGNRDGIANASELAMVAVANLWDYRYYPQSDVRVDGVELAPAWTTVLATAGAGNLPANDSVVTSSNTWLQAQGLVVNSAGHRLRADFPNGGPWDRDGFAISLPPGSDGNASFAYQFPLTGYGFTFPSNRSVRKAGAGSWAVDAGSIPTELGRFAVSQVDVQATVGSPAPNAPLEIIAVTGAVAAILAVAAVLLWVRRRRRPPEPPQPNEP